MMDRYWKTISHSQFEWEREALDFIKHALPDEPVFRAWSNFEFVTPDGAIYEVDLLVLSPQGLWLIEIKSRPGVLRGDAGRWYWENNGKHLTSDNPLLLTNRKAKALASLISRNWSSRNGRPPWIEPLVFLSGEQLTSHLQGPAKSKICLRDRGEKGTSDFQPGIISAILERNCPGLPPARYENDLRTARELEEALENIGIRPSESHRRVGEYICKEMLDEVPGKYQDWKAEHTHLDGVFGRIKRYLVSDASDEEERKALVRAAKREFSTLQALDHPGILAANDYYDHELGPALRFAYDPDATRLDHFVSLQGAQLSVQQRLTLIRDLADTVRYAHRKGILHRTLIPSSVLVSSQNDSEELGVKLFNWQVSQKTAGQTLCGDLPLYGFHRRRFICLSCS